MKDKGSNINEFEVRDQIVRVSPATYPNGATDGSYRDVSVSYLGISDGKILIRTVFGNKSELDYEAWKDGWKLDWKKTEDPKKDHYYWMDVSEKLEEEYNLKHSNQNNSLGEVSSNKAENIKGLAKLLGRFKVKNTKTPILNESGKSIYDFQEGDIITKVTSTYIGDSPIDSHFIGEKIRFLGIHKGNIWYDKLDDAIMKHNISSTEIKYDENGWELYSKGMDFEKVKNVLREKDNYEKERLRQIVGESTSKNKRQSQKIQEPEDPHFMELIARSCGYEL